MQELMEDYAASFTLLEYAMLLVGQLVSIKLRQHALCVYVCVTYYLCWQDLSCICLYVICQQVATWLCSSLILSQRYIKLYLIFEFNSVAGFMMLSV